MAIAISALAKYRSTPVPTGYPSDTMRLFAPVDDVRGAIKACISSATQSIDIAEFAVTDTDLIDLLKQKSLAGILRTLALDSTQYAADPEHKDFATWLPRPAAITVGTSEKGAYMHLKEVVIDGTLLLTGSTNWSVSGQTQQDNSLTVIRNPILAAEASQRIQSVATYQRQHPQGQKLGAVLHEETEVA